MFTRITRKIQGHFLLYRISDGPWDYFRTSHLNWWLSPLRYHSCDWCLTCSISMSAPIGLLYRLFRRTWHCPRCQKEFQHVQACTLTDCRTCWMDRRSLLRRREKGIAHKREMDANDGQLPLFGKGTLEDFFTERLAEMTQELDAYVERWGAS